MLGYKRILCALNYDEFAMDVFRVAAAVANESSASLYILHVARIPVRDMDVPLGLGCTAMGEECSAAFR
jgi:hypothetical protein